MYKIRRELARLRRFNPRNPRNSRLIQTAGEFCTFNDLTRDGPGAAGAILKGLLDVVQVGRQLRPLFAHWGEVIPVVVKEGLLEVAVSQTAGSQTRFEIRGDIDRS